MVSRVVVVGATSRSVVAVVDVTVVVVDGRVVVGATVDVDELVLDVVVGGLIVVVVVDVVVTGRVVVVVLAIVLVVVVLDPSALNS